MKNVELNSSLFAQLFLIVVFLFNEAFLVSRRIEGYLLDRPVGRLLRNVILVVLFLVIVCARYQTYEIVIGSWS